MRPYLSAIALTTAVIAATPAFAQDSPNSAAIPAGKTMLNIIAEGKVSEVPDLATIRAGVVTQAQTAQAALAQNSQRMNAVLAALKKAGIADRDIQTSSVSLNPQYQYTKDEPPTINGYQASNTVSIRFRDIDKSGGILDALVKQGANQIQGPNLSIADEDSALDAARRDAVQKARARAALYAAAAGLKVDRILSISEQGSSSPNPPMPMVRMAAMAKDSSTQIAPGEQDVTVTLNVTFLLQ
ncbi:SIMPL domain-containing protein [Stakelama sediminis]|uniref:SIMPL domain-containing protein n=1 Tax=Stakelama sediminis TaxID=463200 RepID=A0A840YXW0_9SPHN|nr:SIMPL domain-containing protein [Stakelama sediminis]MBB5718369.1 hypothetical protein [Stakelama sediminis]